MNNKKYIMCTGCIKKGYYKIYLTLTEPPHSIDIIFTRYLKLVVSIHIDYELNMSLVKDCI